MFNKNGSFYGCKNEIRKYMQGPGAVSGTEQCFTSIIYYKTVVIDTSISAVPS